jgi:uncharacterized protein (TIGR00730 family)
MSNAAVEPRRRVAVFCASADGNRPEFVDLAESVGALLAGAGVGTVYGGGRVGLMGAVARGALAAGGEVIGVIPEQLAEREVAHLGLTSLEVTASMHARKARMAELADGFIALPGGFGTLEEMVEILTWNQLGIVSAPVVLCDTDDGAMSFWAPLLTFFDHAVGVGLLRDRFRDMVRWTADAHQAVEWACGAAPEVAPKWAEFPPRP